MPLKSDPLLQLTIISLGVIAVGVIGVLAAPFVLVGGLGYLIYQHYQQPPPVLGYDLPEKEPEEDPVLTDDHWKQHCAILAPTGHGKTNALELILRGHLVSDDPPALFVIDSMGSLLKKLERIEYIQDRLVVIDPKETPPLRLFGFDAPNSLYFYLFKAIDQSLTGRQIGMIGYLMQLMRTIPNANLDTLIDLCENKLNPDLSLLDERARRYFKNQFFGKDRLVNDTKAQLASRLYNLTANKAFGAMLSAETNMFDPYQCMQERKVVLIDTDPGTLEESYPVFGRFMIAQIMAAARKRRAIPEKDRHLALLIIDEAKEYFDDKTEEILTDARQMGLGLVFATQHLEQIPDPVKKAIFGNVAIKIIGDVAHSDATALAREMRTDAEFIKSMQPIAPGRPAEFAIYARGHTQTAEVLRVPYGSLDEFPMISESERLARRSQKRETHTATKTRKKEPPVSTVNIAEPPNDETEYDRGH